MLHRIRSRVLDEGMQWDTAVALRHRWMFRSSEAWRTKGRKQALSGAAGTKSVGSQWLMVVLEQDSLLGPHRRRNRTPATSGCAHSRIGLN